MNTYEVTVSLKNSPAGYRNGLHTITARTARDAEKAMRNILRRYHTFDRHDGPVIVKAKKVE